jgi:hypothetical protein
LIARERPERLGLSRMLNPQKFVDTAGLTQVHPYDPAHTPVVFVHGLQETPASWAPMVNSLRDDPWIRKNTNSGFTVTRAATHIPTRPPYFDVTLMESSACFQTTSVSF